MALRTYYEILGVKPTDNLKTIKLAWRAAAKALHPDANPTLGKGPIQAVNLAYEELGDPQKRAKYNLTMDKIDDGKGSTASRSSTGPTKRKEDPAAERAQQEKTRAQQESDRAQRERDLAAQEKRRKEQEAARKAAEDAARAEEKRALEEKTAELIPEHAAALKQAKRLIAALETTEAAHAERTPLHEALGIISIRHSPFRILLEVGRFFKNAGAERDAALNALLTDTIKLNQMESVAAEVKDYAALWDKFTTHVNAGNDGVNSNDKASALIDVVHTAIFPAASQSKNNAGAQKRLEEAIRSFEQLTTGKMSAFGIFSGSNKRRATALAQAKNLLPDLIQSAVKMGPNVRLSKRETARRFTEDIELLRKEVEHKKQYAEAAKQKTATASATAFFATASNGEALVSDILNIAKLAPELIDDDALKIFRALDQSRTTGKPLLAFVDEKSLVATGNYETVDKIQTAFGASIISHNHQYREEAFHLRYADADIRNLKDMMAYLPETIAPQSMTAAHTIKARINALARETQSIASTYKVDLGSQPSRPSGETVRETYSATAG